MEEEETFDISGNNMDTIITETETNIRLVFDNELPKGLNPNKAINEIKKMLIKRAV